eukprot:SAG11_NODE_2627_length_3160_cov_2.201895_2_plen_125_part_00
MSPRRAFELAVLLTSSVGLRARVFATDGGKAAMRLPAVLTQYALSVCSGDFDDWVLLNAGTHFAGRYSCSICAGDFNDWVAKNVSTAFRGSTSSLESGCAHTSAALPASLVSAASRPHGGQSCQ